MTYEDWLKTQPDDVVRDILGPTRFGLYKAGTPIDSFVTDGRMLTLEQVAMELKPNLTFDPVNEDTSEAVNELRNLSGIKEIDLAGVPKNVIEQVINKGFKSFIKEFPEIKDMINSIKTIENMTAEAQVDLDKNTFEINMVSFNSMQNLNKIMQIAKLDKVWPEGTQVHSTITHDLVHYLDKYITNKNGYEFNTGSNFSKHVFEEMQKKFGFSGLQDDKIMNGLSNYASRRYTDFLAEGVTEYMDSNSPREIATAIWNEVELEINRIRKLQSLLR